MTVATIEELDALVAQVKAAQQLYAGFTQEQVDVIFRGAALAAADARIPLARMAVEETGLGVLEDKVIKNHFASEYIYNAYKDEKTCGVLAVEDLYGTMTIAEPVGLICGIVPSTNPTSTAIFKALISLKTRNGIVFSPHPRARRSTCSAARLVLEAAVAAGAPPGIIGWIDEPTVALGSHLMHHPDINLILATGGPGMVRAAALAAAGVPVADGPLTANGTLKSPGLLKKHYAPKAKLRVLSWTSEADLRAQIGAGAFLLGLPVANLGLGRGNARLLPGAGCLQEAVVKLRQKLTGVHVVANLHRYTHHTAIAFRRDVGLLLSHQRAGGGV